MKEFTKIIVGFFTNRLVWLFVVILALFYLLVVRLFDLQIIKGEQYKNDVKATTLKDITVLAPRGTIYDRKGVPLAINESSFIINIDQSIDVKEWNEVLLSLHQLLDQNGEEVLDNFPISKEKPYTFLFDGNEKQETHWKTDMNLDKGLTAPDAFVALRKKFKVADTVSDEDARKILSFRSELYLYRYSKFKPITVASDVKTETIAAIEEQKSNFPGVNVAVEPLRRYPQGKYFSHLIGYIRGITTEELDTTYAQYGYTQTDLVGKDGIEKAFELDLNGKNGKMVVEVDSLGSRVSTIESETVDPIPGNKIFLTVDTHLQKYVYDQLEITLRDALISKLTGKNKAFNYSVKQVLASMMSSGNISLKKIMEAEAGTVQAQVRAYALSTTDQDASNQDALKKAIVDGITKGGISATQMILVLHEQGIISGDEKYIADIKRGRISPLSVIVQKLNSLEITPQMTALDPSTGAVSLVDVHTGDVLAMVSYPSYDNNEFVNVFNNQYYMRVMNEDPTNPYSYRPLAEPRAPGSTFKMITAIAGLEEGIITPTSTTYDKGTFKDAGLPYARCWIGSGSGSHGNVNVAKALEVSCNYFFYDLSYRLGNVKMGNRNAGIEKLNKYMRDFGLDSFTGVEIYELYDSMTDYPTHISSPEYRRYIESKRNPDATEGDLQWYDGQTIRTAIGQSYNNYTPAIMSKYVATLANGGTRYALHFLDKKISHSGQVLSEYTPKVELELNIAPKNIKAVHQGMLAVTSGANGTIRGVFKDFPIKVAAKTGTAQQSTLRSNHTCFVGFAPYDNPQIAIAVSIPFGEDSTAPAGQLAKRVIAEYMGLNTQPETQHDNFLAQ